MKIPHILYGTAWKKDLTSDCVVRAITAGFRGIDTAAQPKHYYEKGVGDALQKLRNQGVVREDLFLQTKFTPVSGQDPTQIPYDPTASLGEQVAQSFSSSQKNLGTEYVESLVLHSPLDDWDDMMEVWGAMESLCEQGKVKVLGISNCYDLEILRTLYHEARIKPQFVQNRFYAETSYDKDLRAWCGTKNMIYQSFWTLTANPQILTNANLRKIAQKYNKSEPQIFFRFLTQIGIIPLTGTQSDVHMREDLEIFNFELHKTEMQTIQLLLK